MGENFPEIFPGLAAGQAPPCTCNPEPMGTANASADLMLNSHIPAATAATPTAVAMAAFAIACSSSAPPDPAKIAHRFFLVRASTSQPCVRWAAWHSNSIPAASELLLKFRQPGFPNCRTAAFARQPA